MQEVTHCPCSGQGEYDVDKEVNKLADQAAGVAPWGCDRWSCVEQAPQKAKKAVKKRDAVTSSKSH